MRAAWCDSMDFVPRGILRAGSIKTAPCMHGVKLDVAVKLAQERRGRLHEVQRVWPLPGTAACEHWNRNAARTDGRSIGRLAGRLYDNAYLLLIFTALFWAGNQVLGRAVVGQIPPIHYSFLRWLGATLLILPFAWPHLRGDWANIKARWLYLVIIGSVGGGMFNTLQYIGLNYTSALNSLVLNSTGPIFIGLACFIAFRDKITLAQLLGTLVSTAGVLAIVTRGDIARPGARSHSTMATC